MATTKKTVTVEDEVIEAKAVKEVKKGPWAAKVSIQIPRSNEGEGNYLIASVNSRVFKLQRGITIDVPAPLAAVLQNSFEAQEEAIRFIDRASN